MLGIVRRWRQDILDTFYPPRCAVCGMSTAVAGRFCPPCDAELREHESRPQCHKCGVPVAVEDLPCQRCGGKGYYLFDRVVRLADFEPPMGRLIHRLKFYHGWPIAELLIDRAVRLPRVQEVLSSADLIVPVPLHAWRQTLRGFNQAEVMAVRLRALTGIPVVHALWRHRQTAAQSLQASRSARFRNVRDAFVCCRPHAVTGRRVLLVDDVITTGATLRAAARALEPARPAGIDVLTLAAVDPKGRAFEYV